MCYLCQKEQDKKTIKARLTKAHEEASVVINVPWRFWQADWETRREYLNERFGADEWVAVSHYMEGEE